MSAIGLEISFLKQIALERVRQRLR